MIGKLLRSVLAPLGALVLMGGVASAAKVTIAEVEELVEPGHLDPDKIHTPGIFVQRILQGRDYKKPIERVTTRPRPGPATGGV